MEQQAPPPAAHPRHGAYVSGCCTQKHINHIKRWEAKHEQPKYPGVRLTPESIVHVVCDSPANCDLHSTQYTFELSVSLPAPNPPHSL